MYLQVDGREAYAYTGGRPYDASRTTVAFIHGAQHDHSVWAMQSRFLAHHGWSVLAFDLPGHGRSAGPLLDDVEAMAAWVLRAIRAAQFTAGGPAAPAVLVGHSMGSLVALEAAGQAPEAVAALGLLSCALPMKVSDALLAAAASDEQRAFDMINFWSHASLAHRPGAPGPGFSVFVQNRRLMERQAPGTTLHDFRACNDYTRGLEQAERIRCPVLLVQGARDVMVPVRAAGELLRRLPQAKVVELAGVGHAVMKEAPDRVRNAIHAWLVELRATAAIS